MKTKHTVLRLLPAPQIIADNSPEATKILTGTFVFQGGIRLKPPD